MKPELSYLAHNLCEIDKYRVETCCVIGESQFFYMLFLCLILLCEGILETLVEVISQQGNQNHHLVNVDSGSLKSRLNDGVLFSLISL